MSEVKEKKKSLFNERLALFLIIMGVGFAWAGFCVDPLGDINGSVLGMTGECFTLAGGLLGMKQYSDHKINKLRRELNLNNEEDEDTGR